MESDAVTKFLDGNACSQAMISTYCHLYGLDRSTALKIAAGFGAGMKMAKTCGALTGAYMVLGLHFGAEKSGTSEGRKEVGKAVSEFTRRFKEKHGVTDCKALLGCDITTEAGGKRAKEEKMFTTVCPTFIKNSQEILNDMLGIEGSGKKQT